MTTSTFSKLALRKILDCQKMLRSFFVAPNIKKNGQGAKSGQDMIK